MSFTEDVRRVRSWPWTTNAINYNTAIQPVGRDQAIDHGFAKLYRDDNASGGSAALPSLLALTPRLTAQLAAIARPVEHFSEPE